jgi:hypothetical protein
MPIYMLLLTNFIVCNQEHFQKYSSIHKNNTRHQHNLHSPNANLYFFFNCTFYAASNFSTFLARSLTIFQTEKTKFKAAIRKYLNTHSFDSVDAFVCIKININTIIYCVHSILRSKMVYICVFVYICLFVCLCICVFVTCSTSYCLCDQLLDP